MKFIQKVNFPKTLKFWYKFLKAFSIQLNWYFFFLLIFTIYKTLFITELVQRLFLHWVKLTELYFETIHSKQDQFD